jgi:hypothetical protein
MADFLSNLLQRSGAAAGATPAPVLQPRLPALFEATGSPQGVSAPPPTPLETIALPPLVESRETLPRSISSVPQAADQPRPALPVTLAPEVAPIRAKSAHTKSGEVRPDVSSTIRADAPVAESHPTLPRQVKPIVGEDLPEPPRRNQTRRNQSPVGKAENAPKRDADPESQPAANLERRLAPVENQPARVNPISRRTERESVSPQSSLPVAARPASPQAHLSEASESVVQIHIGRIEVRAVTPPPPASATRPRPAGPKLSLEDYLHQREGKR